MNWVDNNSTASGATSTTGIKIVSYPFTIPSVSYPYDVPVTIPSNGAPVELPVELPDDFNAWAEEELLKVLVDKCVPKE